MDEKFDQWGIVSLFGHSTVAGKISEQKIGGCSFVRVDVPETDGKQPITMFYSENAIYSIAITGEETARLTAKNIDMVPVSEWEARKMLGIFEPPEPKENNIDFNESEIPF
jgi:hypothetical protein